jgi:hypothetical protein
MAGLLQSAIVTVEWTVERHGEIGYVIETWGGTPGGFKFGPMPRDFLGPFIDERQETIRLIEQKARAHVGH